VRERLGIDIAFPPGSDESDHVVAALLQHRHEPSTDQTPRPGDEDAHGAILSTILCVQPHPSAPQFACIATLNA
jgi:hypothetical protein